MTDSSVHGNIAGGGGGGINTYRPTTLTNTTISDNQAPFGGGIYGNVGDATTIASLILNHVTVAANTYGSSGTGIYLKTVSGNSAFMAARNTIFAGAPGKAVCFGGAGTINSQDHNINTDNSCQLRSPVLNGDLSNTDPLLGPLQDNGGSSYTRALLAGSPAINAGSDTSTNHDQRGFGYNGLPDVGAFEVLLPPGIEVSSQIAMPFTVGERTELYIVLNNPNTSSSRHSNLAFTLTLPSNLVLGTPVVNLNNSQMCGGTITGNPGDRVLNFSGGMNGLTAPGTDCWITLNVRGVAVGSGQVTASGASSLEAGTGLPPTPLEFLVEPASTYLPAVIR